MKSIFLMSVIAAVVVWTACNNANARYIDLNTGKAIKLEKNDSGAMVNTQTKEPVYIYVDTKTNDTIYGKTGAIINGHVIKATDNSYSYDAGSYKEGEYKLKEDNYKLKEEKEGDVKIKDGDTKTKINGETGEEKKKKD